MSCKVGDFVQNTLNYFLRVSCSPSIGHLSEQSSVQAWKGLHLINRFQACSLLQSHVHCTLLQVGITLAVVKVPCTTKMIKSQGSVQSILLKILHRFMICYLGAIWESETWVAHLYRESENRLVLTWLKPHCDIYVIIVLGLSRRYKDTPS